MSQMKDYIKEWDSQTVIRPGLMVVHEPCSMIDLGSSFFLSQEEYFGSTENKTKFAPTLVDAIEHINHQSYLQLAPGTGSYLKNTLFWNNSRIGITR